MTQRDKLAKRLNESGQLVDVRFSLENAANATVEQVCAEANAMLDSFQNGNFYHP